MKVKYKKQQFQEDAARSVVDVFAGQPYCKQNTYKMDKGSTEQSQLDNAYIGVSNREIVLDNAALLEHVQKIQRAALIKPIEKLETRDADGELILTIEMETGVGKTYTYIKTMYELCRAYGWTKFIVVVPSIAIREGVNKSFLMTAEHFAEEYGHKVRFFIYNSSQPTQIDQFASDSGINAMIINTQAFNAAGKDARRIRMQLDEFQSRKPIDIIAAARPILIIDEPQSVEGARTLEGLKAFKPLFVLRYSATHKAVYNMIYRLDAMDAYNKHLVKKISVKGIEAHGNNASGGFLYLERINLSSENPTAVLQFDVKGAKTAISKSRIVKEGANLFDYSKGLEEYRNGYVVTKIDGRDNSVEFLNGIKIYAGDMAGKTDEDTFRRIQIRETILSHIERERVLFAQGIKVLSLFFIDEVANYRRYDAAGNALNGKYADMFEEEYNSIVHDTQNSLFDNGYAAYLAAIDAHQTHAGYFSIDGKGKMINSRLSRRETASDDVSAYDLIMRNKELLLDRDPKKSPVRFIFSHSALREGWDNPNVFQICTLKQSNSEVRKRQEVGRGLRLCVRQDGERMDENVLGEGVHSVNVLTVIASESYDSFARALQSEIAEDIFYRPRLVTTALFEAKTVKTASGEVHTITAEEAVAIYQSLVKADYINTKNMLTDKYYTANKSGSVQFAECVKGMETAIVKILDGIYDPKSTMPENSRGNTDALLQDEKLSAKEFKALWQSINTQTVYKVNIDSTSIIKAARMALNEKLKVSSVYFNVQTGSMAKIEGIESLESGDAFQKEEAHIAGESSKSKRVAAQSTVPYDLVGMLVAKTALTRQTIGSILCGLNPGVFSFFANNPEEFVLKAAALIKSVLALSVVEHITYNVLDKHYETSIFVRTLSGVIDYGDGSGKGNMIKVNKSLYDYIVCDSDTEKKFAYDADKAAEVAIYVKLPKGEFFISTPVGKYSPDWALAFYEGTVKHIYFVAETKGSSADMELRQVEKCKISCAKEHFKAISSGKYIYEAVDSFDALLQKVMK